MQFRRWISSAMMVTLAACTLLDSVRDNEHAAQSHYDNVRVETHGTRG